MIKPWRDYLARFDALSLRERVLVSAAVLAVLAFVIHALVVAPRQKAKVALVQQVVQQQTDLATIRTQLQGLSAQAKDPDAETRMQLEMARAQIERMQGRFRSLERNLVAPQKVPLLLQELLRRKQALRLVSLRTLPVTGLIERKDTPPQKSPGPTDGTTVPAVPEAGIYKHGVEITVQGSYRDLLAYLAELEQLPQQLFWSRAGLRAQYPVSTLTLTVFTLSLERTWLAV